MGITIKGLLSIGKTMWTGIVGIWQDEYTKYDDSVAI
jgi:hypothetical protein